MKLLEDNKPRTTAVLNTQSHQPPLFIDFVPPNASENPLVSPLQQVRDLKRLLQGWLFANQQREVDTHRLNLEHLVAVAYDALARGVTPYQITLLIIAPQFLSDHDHELEVIEVAND